MLTDEPTASPPLLRRRTADRGLGPAPAGSPAEAPALLADLLARPVTVGAAPPREGRHDHRPA